MEFLTTKVVKLDTVIVAISRQALSLNFQDKTKWFWLKLKEGSTPIMEKRLSRNEKGYNVAIALSKQFCNILMCLLFAITG